MSEHPRKLRPETVVGVVFLALTALFLVEVRHYFATGSWVVHGGLGAFERWPMARHINLEITVHAIGMLGWMGVVVHQLMTRGAGAHKLVGRVGAVGVAVALFISLRAMAVSELPILHGMFGASLMDMTLGITVIGILEELGIGVYKVRRGDVNGHRKHLMIAVMFTAGPALYRVNVRWLTGLLDLRGPDASVWQTAWVHEIGLGATLLAILALQFVPWFSGHLDVLRQPEGHDRLERGLAKFMMGLTATLCLIYAIWVVDLFVAWPGSGEVLTRPELRGVVVHMFGGSG